MKLKKLNFRKKKALPSSPKEEDDEDSTTAILTKKTKLEHEMNRDELLELLKKEREAAASGFLAFVERDLACEGKDDTAIEIESDSSSLTVKTEGALDDIERLRCDINQREDNNMNSNMNPDQLKLQDDPSTSLLSSSSKNSSSSSTSSSSSIRTVSNALYSTHSFTSDAANLYFNAMRAKNKLNKNNQGNNITWTKSSDDNKIANVNGTTKKVNVVDMSFNLATFKKNDKSNYSPLDDIYDGDSDDLSSTRSFVNPHVVSVTTDNSQAVTTISNRSQSNDPQEEVLQTIFSSDNPQEAVSTAESGSQDVISKEEENVEKEADDRVVNNSSNVAQKLSHRLAMMSKGKNHHSNYSPLDDIYDRDDEVGKDSNKVAAIPTADLSSKCSRIVESATREIPQLLDPAPTISEKKVGVVAPTKRDKEKVAKSSRKSAASSKKVVSSPVLEEECYNKNNGNSLLERIKNITGPTQKDTPETINTTKDTVEPTNEASIVVDHRPATLSSIGIANPEKFPSSADESPVEMLAKFTSRTSSSDDYSLPKKEEQTVEMLAKITARTSQDMDVQKYDVTSLDSHEGNGILDHLSITSASRESNDILDHLRMTSTDGNSIEKIVTQERTRLSNLLEESCEKSSEDGDERFEVNSKCEVKLKRSTENITKLTHDTKVVTPCSDNEAEVEMILGGSSLAQASGQGSTSSSMNSLEQLLALALASADKPEDVARFLIAYIEDGRGGNVTPPITEVYVSPPKKERSWWSPLNIFSEDDPEQESAASSVTNHSYPNNKTSNNEVCSVETEPKNSEVCNGNTSLKKDYSFISADFDVNENGSNKGGYGIKQQEEGSDSTKKGNQEKIEKLREALVNMSGNMKFREELLAWAANAEDHFSWHSVVTENEEAALGDDGNADEEILNEDNANGTLLLSRAKKESIVSKHRRRILAKIREHKANTKCEDKPSTVNTSVFSPTTRDEEVSTIHEKRASVTSLWDDSASLTVTEGSGSSTESEENIAACSLGVAQELTKDLGEGLFQLITSIKKMLPGVSVEVEFVPNTDNYHELPPKASTRLRKKMAS